MEISLLKEKYAKLVAERDNLKTQLVASESRLELINENISKSLKELKDNFGVSSVDEAMALYKKRSSEIESLLNSCEISLKEE